MINNCALESTGCGFVVTVNNLRIQSHRGGLRLRNHAAHCKGIGEFMLLLVNYRGVWVDASNGQF
jgi:hypothetical protein